jgi:hypothetical protein
VFVQCWIFETLLYPSSLALKYEKLLTPTSSIAQTLCCVKWRWVCAKSAAGKILLLIPSKLSAEHKRSNFPAHELSADCKPNFSFVQLPFSRTNCPRRTISRSSAKHSKRKIKSAGEGICARHFTQRLVFVQCWIFETLLYPSSLALKYEKLLTPTSSIAQTLCCVKWR